MPSTLAFPNFLIMPQDKSGVVAIVWPPSTVTLSQSPSTSPHLSKFSFTVALATQKNTGIADPGAMDPQSTVGLKL